MKLDYMISILTKTFLIALISTVFLSACSKTHDGNEHQHDDHDSHSQKNTAEEIHFSAQTLKNMDIKIRPVSKTTFTVFTPIPARIETMPMNQRPVFAPFNGRVQDIKVVLGQHVKAGQVLLTLIRGPIGRPSLNMVENILRPASENYHQTVADLRRNRKALDLLNTELARLRTFGGGDGLYIVPQKDIIDLKYEKAKVTQNLENDRLKLIFHGLTQEQISKIENGKSISPSLDFWLHALKQNKIWTKSSEELLTALPKSLRSNRWVIATLGELTVEGLITPALIKWFQVETKVTNYFLEIARLLQDGHTLTDIKNLYRIGAFGDIINVRAPKGIEGWDVEQFYLKPGQKVRSGEAILKVTNHSKVYLVSNPQGSDITVLNNALKANSKINASPLISGSGVELNHLIINKITGIENGQSIAYLPVKNTLLKQVELKQRFFRSWSLRNGLNYILKVPQKVLQDVIVLPVKAVIQHGFDKVVFVQKKEQFSRRNVVVVYKDHNVIVLGKGSELSPKDAVVIKGAFALQLALIAGTPQAIDPHAGHNH